MTTSSGNSTLSLYPHQHAQLRLFALWYFAVLMLAWNIAGHTFLGFEQAWIHPVLAVLSALGTQLVLEWLDARALGRRPRFMGDLKTFINYLPPAMITGFACAMLLYPNERVAPIVFASVLAIASKGLFRIPLGDGRWTHFLNPSNFGIAATLLLLPDVGQAPPYQFTENITGLWHWLLPALILVSGVFVHSVATGRLPLILAWLLAFVAQGIVRAWLGGTAWYVPLMPMSSAGFILFTLYMIPDPATTPIVTQRQIVFGASVAVVYAVLQLLHIVFGLFLALIIVCSVRGCSAYVGRLMSARKADLKQSGVRHGETSDLHPSAAAMIVNASPNMVSNRTAHHPSGNPMDIFQPRITFRDTNVVGNVYFLSYFRWQLEGFLQRVEAERSELLSQIPADTPPWIVTKWTAQFTDPVGARVGDTIEVHTDLVRQNNLLTASSCIVRKFNNLRTEIAQCELELQAKATFQPAHLLINQTEPSYRYQPPWRSNHLDPLELLSWQGTCRELFLLDHAPESIRRVAEGQLILQTTVASLQIHHTAAVVAEPITIHLKLADIKCGQIKVQFDYVAGGPDHPVLLATGSQTMSSKHIVGSEAIACPIPVDILLALKPFARSARLLDKIDQIIDFSRSKAMENLDANSPSYQDIESEKAMAN